MLDAPVLYSLRAFVLDNRYSSAEPRHFLSVAAWRQFPNVCCWRTRAAKSCSFAAQALQQRACPTFASWYSKFTKRLITRSTEFLIICQRARHTTNGKRIVRRSTILRKQRSRGSLSVLMMWCLVCLSDVSTTRHAAIAEFEAKCRGAFELAPTNPRQFTMRSCVWPTAVAPKQLSRRISTSFLKQPARRGVHRCRLTRSDQSQTNSAKGICGRAAYPRGPGFKFETGFRTCPFRPRLWGILPSSKGRSGFSAERGPAVSPRLSGYSANDPPMRYIC